MKKVFLYNLRLTFIGWICAVATWTWIQWGNPHPLKIVGLFALGTVIPLLVASLSVTKFFILPMLRTDWFQDQANAFRYKCNLIGIASMLLIVWVADVITYFGGLAFYNFYRESIRYTGSEGSDIFLLAMFSVAGGFWAILILGFFQGDFLFRTHKK